jgi:hypothetical protein
MPRPAGNSYFALAVLLTLPFTTVTAISTAASQTPPPGGASRQALGGIWVLNRDLGDTPGAQPAPDDSGSQSGSGGGGYGGGSGGRMGGGRRGGRGFGGGGSGGGRSPSAEDAGRQQAIADYLRIQMSDVPKQLTIVVHDISVSTTDDEGRVTSLQTDDKKIDDRVQNGLVKVSRKSHWDNSTLIAEVDIDNGPKILRSYSLSPGGTQLNITTEIDRSGGRPVKISHVYERPVEPK